MSHNHGSDQKLSIAVFINILLTVVQVVAGVLSGSLSLMADALHNLSDAGAIVVAIVARKIGNKAATTSMTYGYKRAEIIGVLINSTTLIIVGLYLIAEAIDKFFNPTPIDGWIVFYVAGIALVIDVVTAMLTYSAGAKENMNIKAAFIHNVSDALASLVVIIAGLFIIYFQLYIVDVIATVMISTYVIFHGITLLKKSIFIIMQAVPEGIQLHEVKEALEDIEGIDRAHHIHIWQLDHKKLFLEAHILLDKNLDSDALKTEIRELLEKRFDITHSTIETREN